MGVREPRIPLRYLQIDPAASRHGIDIALCHENSSSLAKCSDDFKSPGNKLLYSNVGDYEFGDFLSFLFFFFSFFVNTCRSNHTHVGSSSSRDISHGPN